MKFYIDGTEEKIIKNYKLENGNYIIEYLDDTKKYYKENEISVDEIHLEMIKQAIKRDRSLYNKINIKNKLSFIYKYFGLFSTGFAMVNKNDLLFISSLILWIIMGSEFRISFLQLKELKKYRMFLEILNMTEERDFKVEYIDNNEIQKPLTINELDKISYGEMKKLDKAYKLILNKIDNEG